MRADAADEAALIAHATALTIALEKLIPLWIDRSVRLRAGYDVARSPDVAAATEAAIAAAQAAEVNELRELLETDIDAQQRSPMAILRAAVRHPTGVLELAEVPHPRRDSFAEAEFPDDHFGLTPATWSDVHPDLHEPGLAWGAAKAFVHLARRKAEGQR